MNAWDTVLGQKTLESINSIAQDVDKIGRNCPTLRDQFAMSALAGLITTGWGLAVDRERLTRECYLIADAMLAERNKK